MGKCIEFKDLSIQLKDRILFDHVNLTISSGDRFMFLGPNGIGKSLLLQLIFLGNSRELSQRYSGLSIKGQILDGNGNDLLNPATRRNFSYVSQSEDFYKGMTVRDICESSCHGIGIELDEAKLDSYLQSFGIFDKKNQKIKNNVSFGEAKIVHIISRLLKLDAANVLILDEPLNHLSFKNSRVFNNLVLQEIERNPNLSVIMVSHCRAMSFAEHAMVYDVERKNLVIRPYQSYDCFTHDDYLDICP